MSNQKMRVDIPSNPKSFLELAASVYEKHLADIKASPLSSLEANSWDIEGPNVPICLKFHEEAEQLKAKMEAAYKERDLLLDGINKAVRASRDILTGVHHDNMKRLSEWGFTVIEAAKTTTKKTDNKA